MIDLILLIAWLAIWMALALLFNSGFARIFRKDRTKYCDLCGTRLVEDSRRPIYGISGTFVVKKSCPDCGRTVECGEREA